jgi:hypothetical protein
MVASRRGPGRDERAPDVLERAGHGPAGVSLSEAGVTLRDHVCGGCASPTPGPRTQGSSASFPVGLRPTRTAIRPSCTQATISDCRRSD